LITIFQQLFHTADLSVIAELPATFHDWLALLGRMHVIVIHFPIALLLMAALGEVWGRVRGRPAGWTTATLMCGAIGAVVSMALGWVLVWFSGYESSSTLTLHQYLGTATAILAIVTAAIYWRKVAKGKPRWWMTALILIAAMVGLTGHLG
jgi:hypothetical protein